MQAIQRVKAVRHPFLLSMERVEVLDGELVIVMELADHSLQDLLNDQRRDGRDGLPRDELLGYLGEAANVLDYMSLRHGLQHLDIKPANLFVVADHVKVADFGLVRSLSSPRLGDLADKETFVDKETGGQGDKETERRAEANPLSPGLPVSRSPCLLPPGHLVSLSTNLGGITPLYAAPELFQNNISPSCDQYSLAIVYTELLTGRTSVRRQELPATDAPARHRASQLDCVAGERSSHHRPGPGQGSVAALRQLH